MLSCVLWGTGVSAQLPLPPPIHKPRAYELLRYNEDWSFLENPANRSDWLDPIKYMPFGRGGDSSYVSIGGEIRGVDERIQNDNWGGTPYPSNQFWLQRVQLHFDTHFNPQLRCFIQLESGLEEGRAGGPRPIDGKRLDFLNAFCDAGIGTSSHPITLRAGRQEFMFGSGRLVAPREGPNVRQSFYGISLTQSVSSWAVTAFAARPAVDKAGLFDDVPNSSTEFWGLFATRPWSKISRNVWDVYYYGLDRKNAVYEARTAHEVRQTVGTRIASHDPASMEGRIAIPHFDVEGIYQFGSFGTGNIRAWSVATEFGCILPKIDDGDQEEPARVLVGAENLRAERATASLGSPLPRSNALCGDVYELPNTTNFLPANFRVLNAVGAVYTNSLNVREQVLTLGIPGSTQRSEWFGIDYYGQFWIKTPGKYLFVLNADDGADLYIDDRRLIGDDGIHPPQTVSGSVRLEAGRHTIHLPYFQGPTYVNLILQVKAPDEELKVFNLRDFQPPNQRKNSQQ